MPAYNGTHFRLVANLIREIPDGDQPATPTSNLTLREFMAVKALGRIRGNVSDIARFHDREFLAECGIESADRINRLSDNRYWLDSDGRWITYNHIHVGSTEIPSQRVVDF